MGIRVFVACSLTHRSMLPQATKRVLIKKKVNSLLLRKFFYFTVFIDGYEEEMLLKFLINP